MLNTKNQSKLILIFLRKSCPSYIKNILYVVRKSLKKSTEVRLKSIDRSGILYAFTFKLCA